MNALIRVSGVLSNAPFILNLDCTHYINNSKILREAMCFMMDPTSGKKICFVQFPYKFDGNVQNEKNSDCVVFFNINMKGYDGIQGPIYLGTGCVFRRQALYGNEAPMKEKNTKSTCNFWPKWCFFSSFGRRSSRKQCKNRKNKILLKQNKEISMQSDSIEIILDEIAGEDVERFSLMKLNIFEKQFGRSPVFVASTQTKNVGISVAVSFASALEEALHVISCGYEDKTAWGKEVGWIYGTMAEDVVTCFNMHCHGWRSVYCKPIRTAFMCSVQTNLSDYLLFIHRQVQGSVEILLSNFCPIWYGYKGGLKCLQRLSYISIIIYPWMAIPMIIYCILPSFCLLTGKFFIPEVSIYFIIIMMTLFSSIIATSILEMNWGQVALYDWWKNEQFWLISTTSSHIFALFRGIFEVIVGIKSAFFLTKTGQNKEKRSKCSILLIPPMTLLILSIIGLMSGILNVFNGSYDSWGPMFGKILCAIWVIIHLYPCVKGIFRNQDRVPTIVVVWLILLVSLCSLLWVRLNPFVSKSNGPVLEVCGLDCD